MSSTAFTGLYTTLGERTVRVSNLSSSNKLAQCRAYVFRLPRSTAKYAGTGYLGRSALTIRTVEAVSTLPRIIDILTILDYLQLR